MTISIIHTSLTLKTNTLIFQLQKNKLNLLRHHPDTLHLHNFPVEFFRQLNRDFHILTLDGFPRVTAGNEPVKYHRPNETSKLGKHLDADCSMWRNKHSSVSRMQKCVANARLHMSMVRLMVDVYCFWLVQCKSCLG